MGNIFGLPCNTASEVTISSEFEVLKHSAAVGNAYKGGVARFQ
jgi:hypothetical protein